MASSNIEIINRSLALLGVESITSISDNSKEASTSRLIFDDTRAAVFRSHPWNCLIKRASLPKAVEKPVFAFSAAFDLPADFLRLISVEFPDVPYRVESGKILSQNDTMNIEYVALITDVTLYDVLLVDALTARLASDLAQPLMQSSTLAADLWELYEKKLKEARYVDAQENSQDTLETNYWLSSRHGYSGNVKPLLR